MEANLKHDFKILYLRGLGKGPPGMHHTLARLNGSIMLVGLVHTCVCFFSRGVGAKPTYLRKYFAQVTVPQLQSTSFQERITLLQQIISTEKPDVVVGHSRGAGVTFTLVYKVCNNKSGHYSPSLKACRAFYESWDSRDDR